MQDKRTWRYHCVVAIAITVSFLLGNIVMVFVGQTWNAAAAQHRASEIIVIDNPHEADILSDTVSR